MRCPSCGTKLNRLTNIVEGTVEVYSFHLWENNFPAYELEDSYPGNSVSYRCPECEEVLATSEEEAIELLRKSELEIRIDRALEERRR